MKLLPRDVSKGTGKGVVITVADAVVAVPVVELAELDAEAIVTVEEGDDDSVAEDAGVDAVEVGSTLSALDVVLLSSCRLWIIPCAVGGRR